MQKLVIKQHEGDLELCVCGRFKDPQHCVFCGSSFIYGRSSRNKRIQFYNEAAQQIEITIIRNFFCRRCNQEFFEDQLCQAPPARKKDKMRIAGVDTRGNQPTPQRMANPQALQFLTKLAERNPNINLDVVRQRLSGAGESSTSSENIPIAGSAAAKQHDGKYEDEMFSIDSNDSLTNDDSGEEDGNTK